LNKVTKNEPESPLIQQQGQICSKIVDRTEYPIIANRTCVLVGSIEHLQLVKKT